MGYLRCKYINIKISKLLIVPRMKRQSKEIDKCIKLLDQIPDISKDLVFNAIISDNAQERNFALKVLQLLFLKLKKKNINVII